MRDSGGLTHTTFRDILPRTASITVTSSPAGASITVGGQPRLAPHTFTSVVGMLRSIGTSSPQALAGIVQYWKSWSDGGKQTHTITAPSTNTTYTVTFRQRGKR